MTKRNNAKSTTNETSENIEINNATEPNESTQSNAKSKGRKTKGGKLISKKSLKLPNELPVGNIILHLKCSLSELEKYNENYNKQLTDPLLYVPEVPPEIQTYNTITSDLHYNYIESNYKNVHNDVANEDFTNNKESFYKTKVYLNSYNQPSESSFNDKSNYAYLNDSNNHSFTCSFCKKQNDLSSLMNVQSNEDTTIPNTNRPNETTEHSTENTDMSIINQKLKNLKIQLIKNKIVDKKSACFWCSYEFDNPECYIPTYEVDNTICGYGSFCRPECAVAYLMKEHIDDTMKFERYNLINQIYGKIYNYNKNIKPAPNPYYLLDKYYGNLTIKEYRKLLKSNHLLMLVEKPLTRVFPELHEEIDDYSILKSANSNNLFNKEPNEIQYKVKKSNEKKNEKTKTSIIKEQFGL